MENKQNNTGLRPTSNNKVKHRIPGMRRWKKNRGQFWLILIFMTLCFMLMEITFLFSDSMGYTLQEHRLDAYGEWQYAVESISETEEENIRSLSSLKDAGAIWVAGDIVSKEIADTTCLGGMDAEALRLGRISLLEGHFPEKAGEAVIEASILEKLGGQLGDEYTFEIELPPTRSHPSIETYFITVTVCGVIKDYSAGWCISDLPGILVTEETAEPGNRMLPHQEISGPEDSRKQYTLLVKGTTNSENLRRSIQSMDLATGWLSGNEYAYPEMAEGVDRLQNILHILLLFILGVNTLILYVVIRYSVRSRRQEWSDLYVLGATVRRLRGLLVREGLFFCLIAMVSGFLLAVLAFFAISAILPNLLDMQLHFVFSLKNTVLALALGSVSVILAYLIPIMGIRRLATGTQIQNKKRMVRRRTKQKRKAVGWSAIWIRSWGERPLGAVAQMLLLCAILLLPCIGVEMIWETAQEVPDYYERQGGTYVWDSRNDTFSKTKVKKLESIYGVEGVRAWHRYFSYEQEQTQGYEVVIDLQNYQNDAYIQMVLSEQKESQHSITEDIQARIAEIIQSGDDAFLDAYKLDESSSLSRESDLENGYYPITLLGTSSETEIQRCLRNLAEGSENEQAFREGDGAILILHPALLKEGNFRKWKINSDEEGEYLISQGIDVGSVLRVRVDGIWMEIPISGIIYDFEGMDGEAPFPYSPISLVCSDGLFESLVSGWAQTTYSYVAIDASQDADAITDRQVAQVIGRANSDEYKNNRLGYEILIQELLLRISFTLVLCGMGTVLSLIIFCHLQATRRREQQEQWELLTCLGMKKRWRQRFAIADAMIPALAAIGMVTLILNLFYNYVHNITNIRLGRKLIWNFLVGIDVSWYCVICIVYLIIVLCVMQVSGQDRKKE